MRERVRLRSIARRPGPRGCRRGRAARALHRSRASGSARGAVVRARTPLPDPTPGQGNARRQQRLPGARNSQYHFSLRYESSVLARCMSRSTAALKSLENTRPSLKTGTAPLTMSVVDALSTSLDFLPGVLLRAARSEPLRIAEP